MIYQVFPSGRNVESSYGNQCLFDSVSKIHGCGFKVYRVEIHGDLLRFTARGSLQSYFCENQIPWKILWTSGHLVLDCQAMGLYAYCLHLWSCLVISPKAKFPSIIWPLNIRLCIICASTIYTLAGRAIFAKRKQLRTFNGDPKSLATTITHTFTRHGDSAALDANKAAWVYTRSAILFLMSLLITWVSFLTSGKFTMNYSIHAQNIQVPASIQRVSSLAHPSKVSYGMTVAAGLTLPLMGFWNSVIYLIVSHEAIKDLYIRHVKQRFGLHHDPSESARDDMGKAHTLDSGDSNRELDVIAALGKGSLSESTQGLASNGHLNGSTVWTGTIDEHHVL